MVQRTSYIANYVFVAQWFEFHFVIVETRGSNSDYYTLSAFNVSSPQCKFSSSACLAIRMIHKSKVVALNPNISKSSLIKSKQQSFQFLIWFLTSQKLKNRSWVSMIQSNQYQGGFMYWIGVAQPPLQIKNQQFGLIPFIK